MDYQTLIGFTFLFFPHFFDTYHNDTYYPLRQLLSKRSRTTICVCYREMIMWHGRVYSDTLAGPRINLLIFHFNEMVEKDRTFLTVKYIITSSLHDNFFIIFGLLKEKIFPESEWFHYIFAFNLILMKWSFFLLHHEMRGAGELQFSRK